MLKPTTILNRHCRTGQLLFLVGCAVLLVTASGLYIRYSYVYLHAAVGLSDTGDQIPWYSTAPGVEDDVDDLSILHPEQHVFRDATTIRMTWNVTIEQRAPDGVMRPVYLINGEWSQHKAAEHESSI
jgi:hypothetical protein